MLEFQEALVSSGTTQQNNIDTLVLCQCWSWTQYGNSIVSVNHCRDEAWMTYHHLDFLQVSAREYGPVVSAWMWRILWRHMYGSRIRITHIRWTTRIGFKDNRVGTLIKCTACLLELRSQVDGMTFFATIHGVFCAKLIIHCNYVLFRGTMSLWFELAAYVGTIIQTRRRVVRLWAGLCFY
jgi:hypothetical protein